MDRETREYIKKKVHVIAKKRGMSITRIEQSMVRKLGPLKVKK